MAFQATISEDGDMVILELAGRIDSFAVDDLNNAFDRAMKSGKRDVLLIMKDLEYINSRGIGTLISFFKWVKKVGGMVKIAEVPLNIMQVLNLLGLDGLTLIYDSASDAKASFRRQKRREEADEVEDEEDEAPRPRERVSQEKVRRPASGDRVALLLSGTALLVALILFVWFASRGTGPSGGLNVKPVREKLDRLEERLARLETRSMEMPRVLERVEGASHELSDRVASVAQDLERIREEVGALSGKVAPRPVKRPGAEPSLSRTHRVKEGESLYRIARRYGSSVDELCRLNGIRPDRFIHPGQELVVP